MSKRRRQEEKSLKKLSSKPQVTESVLSTRAFDEVRHYVDKIQNILENESIRVQQERLAFDSVAKKLKQVHFSSTIQLNVGGQMFTTSLQTLTKDAGSMLHAMFSGRFDTKPGEDGSYFIDRDGTCFRYILNYLRTGKLNLPDDKVVRNDVLEEAKFYQIQGIVHVLQPKPFNESVLLSSEHRLWLLDAVDNHDGDCKLLYRATKNGWSSANFHSCCDGKGPTVVVIKSGNNIFGGYTSQSWDRTESYKTDTEAFLFILQNNLVKEPVCMNIISSSTGTAIYCSSSYGPVFGGGHDLCIASDPNSSDCTTAIGNTYNYPPGLSGTTCLTGNQCFTVSEIEVFQLLSEAD